jgi:hypothetical protein
MHRKYFTESDDSLHETLGAVDFAAAIGAMRDALRDTRRGERDAVAIQQLGVRLRAMLRRLIRPK